MKAPIVALVERGGSVRSHYVPNVTANNIGKILETHMHEKAIFYSDDSKTAPSPGCYRSA
jgi:hypothetical protein